MEGKGIDTKSIQEIGWLKLDNAAKLFPAIMSSELTAVFRITATLKEPVKFSAIKEAVEITSGRFPYFSVSLGSGLFWYYLEYNHQFPRIQTEEKISCTAFAVKRKNEPLYRILIKENRVSVEFIHILTDGSGAFEYFKSLLYTYFRLTGITIRSSEGIILPDSPIANGEMEDGYNRFFRRKIPPPGKLTKAWHLPFNLNEKPRLRIIRSEISLDKLLDAARGHKVTVTEYVASVYMFSLQKFYLEEKKDMKRQKRGVLRIEVPVNLRKKFPSKTMRNFSLFVMPEIDLRLGVYTFEEILKIVHHQLQAGTDVKQITRFLSQNVSHEKSPFVRVLPLFIKRMAISAVYKRLGSNQCSGIMTNLGAVNLPAEMEDHIDSFEVVPTPPNTHVKISCAMVTFRNKMRLNFCSISQSTGLEKHFLKHFTDSGIHVKVLNNK
ncbi:MAG: hypothetical protein Q7T72_00560 [Bacteroidales bacterium]|nr:hypothetical protein [Bacteroidales bacterium]MDP3001715.1 hypothetical protein [Bacteroidales bacterium]